MKSRLAQFLQLEQLSPARFADILGVQRSGISHILSGRNKPGFDLMEKIVTKFPDINAEWLITGKGKMYKEAVAPLLLPEQDSGLQLITERNLFSEMPSVKQPVPQPAPQEKTTTEERLISKIIILYSDKSFSEYHPE
jgi:transcriptional regulator with XRE-family HTH domain